MLQKEVEAWRTSRDGAAQRTRDFIRLEKTARQLQTQVDRLVDAYQAGAIKVEELQARRERLEAEKEATQARRQELETQEMARVRLDRLGDDLSAFAATLRAGLDKLDFQGRQRLIRLLLERVVVTGDHVAIEHAIPLSGRFAGLRPREVPPPQAEAQRRDAPREDAGAIFVATGELDSAASFSIAALVGRVRAALAASCGRGAARVGGESWGDADVAPREEEEADGEEARRRVGVRSERRGHVAGARRRQRERRA